MSDVMTEAERAILVSYRDEPLALTLYMNAERQAYYLEDFLEFGSLGYVMDEVFLGESDITVKGKRFLEEFFGYGNLAHILINNDQFCYDYSERKLVKHLEKLVPNEVGDFIRDAQKQSKSKI